MGGTDIATVPATITVSVKVSVQERGHIMVRIQDMVEAVVELHGVGSLHSVVAAAAAVVLVVIQGRRHQKGSVYVNFMRVGGARRDLHAAIYTNKRGNILDFGRRW